MATTPPSPWKSATRFVRGGLQPAPYEATGTPTQPALSLSTTYLYSQAEAMDAAFEGTTPQGEAAFVYARQGNPSIHAFEEAMASAEQGSDAVAFGSGMAAIHGALAATGLVAGTKILTSNQLFGPTLNLLKTAYMPNGVEVVIADLTQADAVERIRAEEPDVVFVESISNPLAQLVDIPAIGAACQEVGAVAIVDNTIASPILLQPLLHGFDLVVHSTTKYIGGHGDSTGGVVVGTKKSLMGQVRLQRNLLGGILSPFEAHLLLRGLRTLPLRMQQHCTNALQVAQFLQDHPAIAQVHYTGLAQHPQHALATRLFREGCVGGLLTFELRHSSRAAALRCINQLQLCLHATTLGDVFTMVSYPPIASHRFLKPEERYQRGITDGCIRLSVGIEDVEDIIRDLDQALAVVETAALAEMAEV